MELQAAFRVAVLLWILGIVFAFTGCTPAMDSGELVEYVPEPAPQVPTTVVPDVALPAQAFVDRTLYLADYSDQQLDDIAQSSLVIFQLRLLYSAEGSAQIAKLRQRNPNIIVLGIQSIEDYHTGWTKANQRERFPMSAEMHDLLAPHTAYRIDGEVATKWEEMPMVNPWQAGQAFNEGLMLAVVDIISRHARLYPDAADGIFHDYLSNAPWIMPPPPDRSIDVDFDGDGVGAFEDDEDRAAWVAWQNAELAELQSRFGEGYIQVGNGKLPLVDANTARMLAGIAYENFPTLVWNYSDQRGMETLLANHAPGYLTPRRGHTWSLLWDPHNRRSEFCRVASMISGQFYGLMETGAWNAADPAAGQAGLPLSDWEQMQELDGGMTFRRSFSGGDAVIQTSSSGATTTIGFDG